MRALLDALHRRAALRRVELGQRELVAIGREHRVSLAHFVNQRTRVGRDVAACVADEERDVDDGRVALGSEVLDGLRGGNGPSASAEEQGGERGRFHG